MVELEEEIMKESEYKPYLWWRYIGDIFFLWEDGENKLKSFIDKSNKVHPTFKFAAEWSKTSIIFLDVTVSLIEGAIETDLLLSLQTVISIYNLARATLFVVKRVYRVVRL